MTDKNANSGVRNLRAMFESQSAASSPEPRGRSPAKISADNDQPISKVRASFVSVEPAGLTTRDLGTTKGTVDGVNSASAHHRESFSVSTELGEEAVAELKKTVKEERDARQDSIEIVESVPEQAVETRESSRAPPPIRPIESTMPNLGSIMKGSDFPEVQPVSDKEHKAEQVSEDTAVAEVEPETAPEDIAKKLAALSLSDAPADTPDQAVSGAQENVTTKPEDHKDEATVSDSEAHPPPTETLPSTNTPDAPPAVELNDNTPSKAKTNGNSGLTANVNKPSAKKPAAIAITKTPISKASSAKSPLPKSPGFARIPKTPTTPKSTSTTHASKSPIATKASKDQPKAAAAAAATAPKASRASLRPSATGITTNAVKKDKTSAPEPKKHVAKPTSASTTSKDTKDPEKGTITSPGGFKKPKPRSPTRPIQLPSHLTAPTKASSAKHGEDGSQKTTRNPTNISRPVAPKTVPAAKKPSSRASLAPHTAPPKRPESRASTKGASEEGFLARMMRPTKASASKTHDKPASPPRRGASVKHASNPKASHESTAARGKKKIGEIAHKAKEVVTNGNGEEEAVEETGQILSEPIEGTQTATAAETSQHDKTSSVDDPVEDSTADHKPVEDQIVS